jgi:hypothetical protein
MTKEKEIKEDRIKLTMLLIILILSMGFILALNYIFKWVY